MIYLVIILACIGCFCAGYLWGNRGELYWRIRWIELENDTARALGKEPRDIKEVE